MCSSDLYDSFGRLLTYTDVITSAAGLETTTIRGSTTLDSATGRVTDYTETSTTDADSVITTTTVSGITYNAIGLQTYFRQDANRKNGAALDETTITKRTMTSSDYDSFGRLLTYTDVITSAAGPERSEEYTSELQSH